MDTISADQITLDGSLPLYTDVAVLNVERHGDCAILPATDQFTFAAGTPTIPITIDEFERAALHYPIVFVGAERQSVIVTGLTPDRNLFVAPDGRYAPGAYIPAYLRRHPFVLARQPDSDQRIVCVDEASDLLVRHDSANAQPLFTDGQPSAITREAIAFCEAFDEAETRTRAFAALLNDHGLLSVHQAMFSPPGDSVSEPILLLEYQAIDRARLEGLDTHAWQALRSANVIGPSYAQLLSANNWDVLPLWAGG